MIYEGGHPARREVWEIQGMHIGSLSLSAFLSSQSLQSPRRCHILVLLRLGGSCVFA